MRFSAFLSLLLVTFAGTGGKCSIMDNVDHLELSEGEILNLKCNANTNLLRSYRWVYIREGTRKPRVLTSGLRLVVEEPRMKIEAVTENEHMVLILTLEDVRKYDSGLFMCWRRGRRPDPQVLVRVTESGSKSSSIQAINVSASDFVNYGGSASINCSVFDIEPHKTLWYKNGRLLIDGLDRAHNQSSRKENILSGSHSDGTKSLYTGQLYIKTMRKSATYTCRIHADTVMEASATVNVKASKIASLVLEPSKDDIDYGETFTITCIASGTESEIEWLKNGKSYAINTNKTRQLNEKLKNGHQKSVLIINGFSFEDNGHYVCYVPGDSRSILVNVEGRPAKIVDFIGPEFHREGHLNVTCVTQYLKNKAELHWLFNNDPIDLKGAVNEPDFIIRELGNNITHYSLHFRPKFKNVHGNYTCKIRNEERTLSVKGSEPPSFTVKPERETGVKIGANVTLSCGADGFPTPEVGWRRSDDDLFITVEVGYAELEIVNFSLTDAGEYVCEAFSYDSLIATSTILLPNRELKMVKIPDPEIILAEQSSTALNCEVESSIPFEIPLVAWYKSGIDEALVSAFRIATYNISNAKMTDNGQYICRANLSGVEKTATTQVEVVHVEEETDYVEKISRFIGESVLFPCPVASEIVPVAWIKADTNTVISLDYSVVINDPRFNVETLNPFMRNLFLTNVQTFDNGIYICATPPDYEKGKIKFRLVVSDDRHLSTTFSAVDKSFEEGTTLKAKNGKSIVNFSTTKDFDVFAATKFIDTFSTTKGIDSYPTTINFDSFSSTKATDKYDASYTTEAASFSTLDSREETNLKTETQTDSNSKHTSIILDQVSTADTTQKTVDITNLFTEFKYIDEPLTVSTIDDKQDSSRLSTYFTEFSTDVPDFSTQFSKYDTTLPDFSTKSAEHFVDLSNFTTLSTKYPTKLPDFSTHFVKFSTETPKKITKSVVEVEAFDESNIGPDFSTTLDSRKRNSTTVDFEVQESTTMGAGQYEIDERVQNTTSIDTELSRSTATNGLSDTTTFEIGVQDTINTDLKRKLETTDRAETVGNNGDNVLSEVPQTDVTHIESEIYRYFDLTYNESEKVGDGITYDGKNLTLEREKVESEGTYDEEKNNVNDGEIDAAFEREKSKGDVTYEIDVNDVADEFNENDVTDELDVNEITDEFDENGITDEFGENDVTDELDVNDITDEFDENDITDEFGESDVTYREHGRDIIYKDNLSDVIYKEAEDYDVIYEEHEDDYYTIIAVPNAENFVPTNADVLLPCDTTSSVEDITWMESDNLLFLGTLDLAGVKGVTLTDDGQLKILRGFKAPKKDKTYACLIYDYNTYEDVVVSEFKITLDDAPTKSFSDKKQKIRTKFNSKSNEKQIKINQITNHNKKIPKPKLAFEGFDNKEIAVLTNNKISGKHIVSILNDGGINARLIEDEICDRSAEIFDWDVALISLKECEVVARKSNLIHENQSIFVFLDFAINFHSPAMSSYSTYVAYVQNREMDVEAHVFGSLVPVSDTASAADVTCGSTFSEDDENIDDICESAFSAIFKILEKQYKRAFV